LGASPPKIIVLLPAPGVCASAAGLGASPPKIIVRFPAAAAGALGRDGAGGLAAGVGGRGAAAAAAALFEAVNTLPHRVHWTCAPDGGIRASSSV
jgi:hypothetical protein